MPNLINTDSAGNVFYNYITPVVRGEALNPALSSYDTSFSNFLIAKLGSELTDWYGGDTYGSKVYAVRLPAPGLESIAGGVNNFYHSNARFHFAINGMLAAVNARNSSDSSLYLVGNTQTGGSIGTFTTDSTHVSFSVMNDYSIVFAMFTDGSLTTLKKFFYLGWGRENVFTGTTISPRGLIAIVDQPAQFIARRPTAENSSAATVLSTAADTITSPPIVCTTGTDPGDGSETATDIVIRDAAAPNNPVGKLWNCIDLPADSVIGGLYRNAGSYDADATTSEQDIYLCVMPWGQRKLGMRVWTENVN